MDNSPAVQILQQILQLLTSGFSQPRAPQSYTGIDRSSPGTINQMIDRSYSSVASSIGGPVGMLLNLTKRFIVPQDFNSYGNLANNYSGILFPSNGGTYAGAFQNFLDRSRSVSLSSSHEKLQDELKRQMYGNYWDIVHKDSSKTEEDRKRFIKKTQSQMINIPKALQFLLDPADINRTMQGIQQAQAGIFKWSNRQDPLSINTFSKSVQVSKSVTQMVKQASKKGAQYGGFSPGAVASLVGSLSQQEDLTMGASPQQMSKALQSLKARIQGMTKALAPLRDIFGNDIPSMISRLQQIAGMQISNMSIDQIKSISTTVTDMSRYSNVSIGHMASMGSMMAAMTQRNGGSNWGQLGAQASGAFAAGLLTPGNGAFGLMPEQYKQNTLNMLAQAQDSQGAQFMAMAYGLAKEGNPKYTMAQFDTKVSKLMATGMSSIQAARTVVADAKGVDPTKINIYEGQATRGNLQYRLSGRGARWASRQLWGDQKNYAIMAARQSGLFKDTDIDKVQTALNQMTASQLIQFGSNPMNFLQSQVFNQDSRFRNLGQEGKKILYSMIERQGARFTQAATWSGQSQQIQKYLQAQQIIRKAFGAQDKNPSNMYSRLVSMATGKWEEDQNGTIISQQTKQAREAAIAVLGQTVLNVTEEDRENATSRTKTILKKLNSLGSQTKTSDIIQYAAIGEGKSNRRFQTRLKSIADKISKGETSDKELYQQYSKLYTDRWTGGNSTYQQLKSTIEKDEKIKDETKRTLSKQTVQKLTEAQKRLHEQVNKKNSSLQDKQRAYSVFSKQVKQISRIAKLQKDQLSQQQGGDTRKRTLLKLFRTQKDGKILSEEQFNKTKGKSKISYNQYKDARNRYSEGYDMKADIMGKLGRVLSSLQQWLKKNMK